MRQRASHRRFLVAFRFLICVSVLLGVPALFVCAEGASSAGELPSGIRAEETAASQWLLAQIVPNAAVSEPSPGRRRLVLGYQVPSDDPSYRFIYGRSFIYDDALAAVALTMLGRYREAEFVLSALARLVRPDGSLWFAYNTQNSWPDETDNDGALVRNGAVAWVGYAFTYYLQARALATRTGAPALPATDPLAQDFQRAARSLAAYLTAHQVADASDPRYGLVTGGRGATTLVLAPSSSAPVERYSPAEVAWVSTEHNIDAWFFLRDLARLTADAGLAARADLIRARLDGLWSNRDGQFFQGIHEDRTVDAVLPLDGASWGALFLHAQGQEARAARCASVIPGRFSSVRGGVSGFRPYGAEPVYTDESVNRYYFPAHPTTQWKDLPFIWGEGSFGVAAALLRTGNRDAALQICDSLRSLSVGGGFRYASPAVPYQFADYPSVASTAWFIIAVEMLKSGPVADAFWGA